MIDLSIVVATWNARELRGPYILLLDSDRRVAAGALECCVRFLDRNPALTRIEYHRSLYHFFRKHRGAAGMVMVLSLRIAKVLFYFLTQAPETDAAEG